MPQLTPFFFTNQTVFVFVTLIFLVYLFSRYILPRFLRSHWGRNIFVI